MPAATLGFSLCGRMNMLRAFVILLNNISLSGLKVRYYPNEQIRLHSMIAHKSGMVELWYEIISPAGASVPLVTELKRFPKLWQCSTLRGNIGNFTRMSRLL